MKNLSFPLTSLFCCLLFLFSCQKECVITEPVVFYQDEEVVLQFECEKDDIIFFIDVIGDTTDGRTGAFPDADFFRLYVDFNANQMIDEDIDLLMGKQEDGTVCVASLIDATRTKPCNFYGDTSVETSFATTDNEPDLLHMSYRLRVPKDRVAEDNTARVIVNVYDASRGWRNFPLDQELFSKAFEISW